MKKELTTIVSILFNGLLFSQNTLPDLTLQNKDQISFTENKGQVCDQFQSPRPDVLFSGTTSSMVFHLRNNGISYQLNRTDSYKQNKDPKTKLTTTVVDQYTTYRLDVNWLNTNPFFKIETNESFPGSANYFSEVHPDGIYNVRTFKGVTYKSIYSNIDLHYYEKNGNLKYDFIVAPNTDYKKIKLEIKGADKMEVLEDGSLLINTPLGSIQEGKPIVFQNGRELKSSWSIKKNVLSFDIQNYNPSYELIIDPATRVWGTYYGANSNQFGTTCALDPSGNVYMAGYQNSGTTYTAMATTGAYQTTNSGGSEEAFIIKFNSSGARLWATYYGGTGYERFYDCKTDASGNLFLVGFTSSTIAIATAASQQSVSGGNDDAFLVKFNSAGVRQWATYFGGTFGENANSCAIDASGNIYMVGTAYTNTGTPITTIGAYQTIAGGAGDAFVAKYNNSGVLQWATYYGGAAEDHGTDCELDALGNIYITGYAASTASISIGTVHQTSYGGGAFDAFLVRFNSSGQPQMATYYGGTAQDYGYSCSVDPLGNIYLCGSTASSTGTAIATSTSHQPNYVSGLLNSYMVKFDSTFTRQWATYYGGSAGNYDEARACKADGFGNIFMVGNSSVPSGTSIATVGSQQSTYGGGIQDSYLAKFDALSGVRTWGTYYGGGSNDQGFDMVTDNSGNIYMCGGTVGTYTEISTPGAYQPANGFIGGTFDAFLVKFYECAAPPSAPANTTSSLNLSVCGNASASLSASGFGAISWYSTPSSTTVLGSGATFITPTLSAGTYTYYVEAVTCTTSVSRLAITVTVNPVSPISVTNGSICSGQSFTLSPTGAANYTFQGGSNIVSPLINTTYTIVGANGACLSSNTATASILVFDSPTISVSNGTLCSGNNFTLTPSGASNYTYSGGSNIVSPGTNTVYSIIGSSSVGCLSSNTATASITVLVSPVITVNNGTICSGQTFTIVPSGAQTYTYAGGSSIVSPLSSTSFSVVGTNSLGCRSNSVSANIVVNLSPTITVSNGSVCIGNTYSISPTGANTYTFSGGSATVNPVSNSSYTITGTSLAGCISPSAAIITISVIPLPTITVNSGTLCSGKNFTIQPSGASTYTYSGGTSIVSPATNTIYSIVGTSSLGCISNTATSTVTVLTSPVISVNNGTICSGQVFTIIPTGAQSYTYQGGSANVSPGVSTTFSVVGTNSLGCISNSVTSNITVNITPTIAASNGTVCTGNVFTINPTGANSYSYSSLSATVIPSGITSYTIAGFSLAGCISSTVSLTVSPIPLPTVTVISGSVCPGGIFTITPSGAVSYTYSTIANTLSPISTTTFSVMGTNTAGCVSASPALGSVSIYNLPLVTITGPAISCAGVSQTLQANGALTYTWNLTTPASSLVIFPTSNNTYSVMGTDANGCKNTASKTVSVNPLPTLSVSGTGTICQGLSVSLLVSGSALTYTWSNGTIGNLLTVTPTISTAYTVTGTDVNNCSNSTSQSILVNTLPPVVANASNINICAGSSAILFGSGASTYSWSGGVINNSAFYPGATSVYTVSGTGTNGCKNTATIQVAVNPNPTLSLVSNSSQTICNGDVVILTASGANIYSWSTGDITNTISVTPSLTTTYSVIGTDANGCSTTATFNQLVNECTGVSKINFVAGIIVSPNPNAGDFQIFIKDFTTELNVEIYNSLGQLIQKTDLNTETTFIKLNTQAKGIYLVKIYNRNQPIKEDKIIITE